MDAASVQVGAAPNSGMAEVNPDGAVTYMPTAGYTGTDSFTYTVKDSAGAMSNVATVTVTVLPLSPAQQTAEQNDVCTLVQPFYFEIGDEEGAIASASIGADAPTATTQMEIASGTKWLLRAYVAEVRSSALSWADLMEMRMLSGYVSMGALRQCDILSTVSSCFNTAPNNAFTATSLGRFDYGSGHFHKWGVDSAGLALQHRPLG